jgi:hypothetical protein
MKTLPNTQPDARKFPLVDYHYHAPMLNSSSAPCLKTSKSLRSITRDYFDDEADREFISEAAVFTTLIIAMAVVPITVGISAMLQLLSTLPSLF